MFMVQGLWFRFRIQGIVFKVNGFKSMIRPHPSKDSHILLLKSKMRVKFGALRGKESAVRAPQLPAGCNVEHFSQNGFRTVFCEVMGGHAGNKF